MKKLLFLLCVVVAGSMFYLQKITWEGPMQSFCRRTERPEDRQPIQQESIGRFLRVYSYRIGWR